RPEFFALYNARSASLNASFRESVPSK
ncbi:hypothetical protein VCHENC02_1199B, partial [Vibrio harveyi]